MTTAILKSWTKPGTTEVRQYVQNLPELINLDCSFYKTGNVSSASLRGEHISNSKATGLLSIRAWVGQDGRIWVGGNDQRVLSNDEIGAAVRAALPTKVA